MKNCGSQPPSIQSLSVSLSLSVHVHETEVNVIGLSSVSAGFVDSYIWRSLTVTLTCSDALS